MSKKKRGQPPFLNKGQKCSVSGCKNGAKCKTFCAKHYYRFMSTGDVAKTPCDRPHGRRNICKIKDCGGIVEGFGYCHKHYKKFKKYGNPLAGRPKGDGRFTKEGYILLYKPDWKTARKDGYVLEHRYIIEKKLGRSLKKSEIVHHKNGIRNDNRLSNLEVMTIKKHYKGSSPIICPKCNYQF